MKTIEATHKLRTANPLVAAFGLAVLASAISTAPARAGNDISVGGEYSLSIAGIPFAKGSLSMAIKGDLYAARAKIATWGVARLVVESNSYVESSGHFGGSKVRPAKYSMDSQTKEFNTLVRMRLSGGAIRDLSARPSLRALPDRVPVKSRHKANILDPLSAAIVPYRRSGGTLGADACNKTLPIFDGWTRFDVKLHFRKFAEVNSDGYTGKAVVCGARWVPVAGHRLNKQTVVYLQENKDLEAWLIPVAGSNFLVPYRMSIKTKSGTLLIQNKRLVVTGAGAAKKHARK